MNTVLAHAQACIETAMQLRPLFDSKPQTTEKLAAHALFLRCIDHFRAVVTLGQQGLDVEALSLTRGISEALFVIGALLKGFLTTEQLEDFDLAQKAKNAREMSDFLKREAPPELQQKMSDYWERNKGETNMQFKQLAQKIGESDLYDGYYRMFSHVATHPSISAVQKYLDYGESGTTVHYPGKGHSAKDVVLIAATALLHVCAGVEKWLGTTPSVNQAIHARLIEHEAFGPRSEW
jgi:hypothetical protein